MKYRMALGLMRDRYRREARCELSGQNLPERVRRGSYRPSDGYFACALEVMEAITLVAILNCSSRLSMPWRRAIQLKSV